MKGISLLVGSILLIMAAFVAIPSLALCSSKAMPPKPEMFVWASMDVATSIYIQYSAVGEGILKKFRIKLRAVPVRAEVARITLMRTGQVHAGMVSASTYFVWKGTEAFASRAWGPQPIRTVWLVGRKEPSSAVTRKDSGIKTVDDIKGKRVARYIGSPSLSSMIDAVLAFANLTWDDVIPVKVGSYSEALKQMIAGRLDVCHAAASSSLTIQLAASPGGLYWIPLPIENKEGWKRYKKVNPIYYPIRPKYGVNIDRNNPPWLATGAYPTIYAYDTIDEDIVYWMTKAIAESFPVYKDAIKPNMEWWSLESFLSIEALTPYHKGTIRYIKEKGLWTDSMEARQRMLIEKEKELKAAWENTIREADEKKMSDKKFPAFWLKRLEALEKKL